MIAEYDGVYCGFLNLKKGDEIPDLGSIQCYAFEDGAPQLCGNSGDRDKLDNISGRPEISKGLVICILTDIKQGLLYDASTGTWN